MANLSISRYEVLSETDMESRYDCFEYNTKGVYLFFEIDSLISSPLFLSKSFSCKSLSIRTIRRLGDYNELDFPTFDDAAAVNRQIYRQIYQDIPRIVSETHDKKPVLLGLTLELLASVAEVSNTLQ